MCCSYKRILSVSSAAAAEEELKRLLRIKGYIKFIIYLQLRQCDKSPTLKQIGESLVGKRIWNVRLEMCWGFINVSTSIECPTSSGSHLKCHWHEATYVFLTINTKKTKLIWKAN